MRPTDRTRKARADERRYPVRVRVAVPEGGTINCGPDYHAWLDRECGGRSGWDTHSAYETTRPVESFFLYVPSIAIAAAFLERFDLETVELAQDWRVDKRGDTFLHLHGVPGHNRTRKAKV